MVSLTSAENALKSYYLGVVANQLNTGINPLLAKIRQTSSDVWGKEVRKLAPYGLNGGISAGTETGELPAAGGNSYEQLCLTLKNLYGKIEISDKAVRASQSNAGAFVNLLNAEMEGLLTAAAVNVGRMLFGDGSGKLATVAVKPTTAYVEVDTTLGIMEGQILDFCTSAGPAEGLTGFRVLAVDRANNELKLDRTPTGADTTHFLTVQGSFNNELTGLGAIFATSGTIYGLSKSSYSWLVAHKTATSTTISDAVLQKMADSLEMDAGSRVNMIVCSAGVRRAYQNYLLTNTRNVDVVNLEGGYKAISFSGIPLVADKFCPAKHLYMLNTDDFKLHQLCDWKWLEGENGRVLRQMENKPVYTATLVKYADLMCDKIYGQGVFTNITEA